MISVNKTPRHGIARFSECGHYRYLLVSEFGGDSTCVFIMLNPSTADGNEDDPTIRRCIYFSKREGFGRLEVVNLYAYRSPSPTELVLTGDPVGPGNNYEIEGALLRASLVVAAWGNRADPVRVHEVANLIDRFGKPVKCFGLTKLGNPRHPLYSSSKAPLEYLPGEVLTPRKNRIETAPNLKNGSRKI